MGVMKKYLILGFVMTVFTLVPSNALVTVEEQTDAEYLINEGYSQATAESVFYAKNRVNGKPIEPLYDKKQNKCYKFLRSIQAYIDPSIDSVDRIHHEIKMSPSYSDL